MVCWLILTLLWLNFFIWVGSGLDLRLFTKFFLERCGTRSRGRICLGRPSIYFTPSFSISSGSISRPTLITSYVLRYLLLGCKRTMVFLHIKKLHVLGPKGRQIRVRCGLTIKSDRGTVQP